MTRVAWSLAIVVAGVSACKEPCRDPDPEPRDADRGSPEQQSRADQRAVIILNADRSGPGAAGAVDGGVSAVGLAFAARVRRYAVAALAPLCPEGAVNCVVAAGPPAQPIVVLDDRNQQVMVYALMEPLDNSQVENVDLAFDRLVLELSQRHGAGYQVIASITNVKSQLGEQIRALGLAAPP